MDTIHSALTSFTQLSHNAEMMELLPVGVIILDEEMRIAYFNRNTIHISPSAVNPETGDPDPELIKKEYFEEKDFDRIKNGEIYEKLIRSQKTLAGGEIQLILKCVPYMVEEHCKGAIVVVEDVRLAEGLAQKSKRNFDPHFEALLNRIWSLFLIVSPEGKILFQGGNKVALFRTAENRDTEFLQSFFDSRYDQKVVASFKGALIKRQPEEIMLDVANSAEDGGSEFYECAIIPLVGEKYRIQFLFITIREITVFLKMIENYKRELQELQQYYQFTQDIAEAVIGINSQGRIIFWNKGSEITFRLRRSEVFGKHISRVFTELKESKIADLLDTYEMQFSQEIILSNGQVKVVNCRSMVKKDPNVGLYCLIMGKEVTNEVDQTRHLQEQLTRYEHFFRTNKQPAAIMDETGKIESCNTIFEQTFYNSTNNSQQSYFLDLIDPAFVVEKDLTFYNLTADLNSESDVRMRTSAGEYRVFHCIINSFEIAGQVHFFVHLNDIQEKITIANELEMLRSIIDYTNDGIGVELNGTIVLLNDSFARLYGYKGKEELIGQSVLTLVTEQEIPRIREYTSRRKNGKEAPGTYEFLAKRKDGSTFQNELSVTMFTHGENMYFVVVSRDITESKVAQKKLKDSEEKYRSITENLDDFFWTAELINSKIRTIFYSSSVEKITGYTPNEMLADGLLFFRIIYPDDFPLVKERLKRFYNNYYKRSDEIEFRIMNKSGNIVWIRNKINVIRDRKGKVMKIFGLVSDVSMQKKAEDELTQSSLKLQKLNETKDKFISIISHDLRTPFSSIMGFTDLLLGEEDDLTPEEARQYVKYIQESAQNMLSLVNSLLDWTRIQTGRVVFEPKHINLYEFINSIFSGLNGVAWKKGISLINEVDKEIVVFVDHNLTMQIFNNLLSNSLKFTATGGSITIASKQSEHPRFEEITVSDTGVGIKPEDLHKVFNVESKFTTDGTAGEKGSGLGLSLVKEIIEKHGGKIRVDSTYNVGTTFTLTLPKASATILMVDDSNTDRILYSKIIKNMVEDYDIITAKNGKEALEIVQETSFALIITDHAMPVMNGVQFIEEFKKLKIAGKPPLMVLSGDMGKSEQLMYSDLGIEYIFTKPVNLVAFKAAIEKCLKQLPK
ncbi:MAG: PAS domain S-box protein [Ignavibacteria bacterium]|nr:PAS domain S-box protein [Ignavibacteria bacterium]